MPNDTIASLLAEARLGLTNAGLDQAALDARLLLQHATGLGHASIIADPDKAVLDPQAQIFRTHLALRLQHQPISRILGYREFYGRRFAVTRDVLDPRPDTETLIDLSLAKFRTDQAFSFIDLGCGSGAIGITIACERPESRGMCTDSSRLALQVAKANIAALGLGARLSAVQSDWLSGISGKYDLIVSNPPYIASGDIAGLSPDVRNHDPHMALDGGQDGLDCYRLIAGRTARHLSHDGAIVVEIGAGQAADVTSIFASHGLALRHHRADLSGHTRALMFSVG